MELHEYDLLLKHKYDLALKQSFEDPFVFFLIWVLPLIIYLMSSRFLYLMKLVALSSDLALFYSVIFRDLWRDFKLFLWLNFKSFFRGQSWNILYFLLLLIFLLPFLFLGV